MADITSRYARGSLWILIGPGCQGHRGTAAAELVLKSFDELGQIFETDGNSRGPFVPQTHSGGHLDVMVRSSYGGDSSWAGDPAHAFLVQSESLLEMLAVTSIPVQRQTLLTIQGLEAAALDHLIASGWVEQRQDTLVLARALKERMLSGLDVRRQEAAVARAAAAYLWSEEDSERLEGIRLAVEAGQENKVRSALRVYGRQMAARGLADSVLSYLRSANWPPRDSWLLLLQLASVGEHCPALSASELAEPELRLEYMYRLYMEGRLEELAEVAGRWRPDRVAPEYLVEEALYQVHLIDPRGTPESARQALDINADAVSRVGTSLTTDVARSELCVLLADRLTMLRRLGPRVNTEQLQDETLNQMTELVASVPIRLEFGAAFCAYLYWLRIMGKWSEWEVWAGKLEGLGALLHLSLEGHEVGAELAIGWECVGRPRPAKKLLGRLLRANSARWTRCDP